MRQRAVYPPGVGDAFSAAVARRKETAPGRDAEASFEGQVDDHDALWSALGRLSPQHRVVVVLRIVEDLSEEQTAAMLGVARGTVKSRLSRALAVLRSVMDGTDD